MRADWFPIERYRIQISAAKTPRLAHYGWFLLPLNATEDIVACAHDGSMADGMPEGQEGWEHVSARVIQMVTMGQPKDLLEYSRICSWDEMCVAKRFFWDEEETVMQFHPPASLYSNCHPHVLHLWKPVGIEVEMPNVALVGNITGPAPYSLYERPDLCALRTALASLLSTSLAPGEDTIVERLPVQVARDYLDHISLREMTRAITEKLGHA